MLYCVNYPFQYLYIIYFCIRLISFSNTLLIKSQLYMYRWIIFIIASTTLLSCSKKNDYQLEYALKSAGDNKVEIIKVLNHYKDDSLKYKAALFLIVNMPFHIYYDGKDIDKYYKYFSILPQTKKKPEALVDSLEKADGKFIWNNLRYRYDIQELDSTFLVKNIDQAFKVWREQPWGKNICFNDFCEYILPYRLADEKPEYWREALYNKYNPKLDSIRLLPESTDPLFVAQALLDTLIKEKIYFTCSLPEGPHIGANIVNWKSGSCRELADYVNYVFRSVGIPCGTDFMIMRGDNNAAHYWNFVLDKDGKTYEVEFPNGPLKEATSLWNPKSKVYRNTFSLNLSIVQDINKPTNEIYPFFRIPLFKDVTKIYAGKWNRTLVLPHNIIYDTNKSKNILYLCLSNHDIWIPVAYTKPDNDSIRFRNVEGDVIFRLGTWNGNKLEMCSDPFLYEKKTGKIQLFNSQDTIEKISIFFKYHLYNENYIFRMPGGTFEGSNNPNFENVDTLFLIKNVPERLYNTLYTNSSKRYRYVRYKGGKGSYCNISEIEFYDSEKSIKPLKGKIIGTPGCYQQDGSHEYTNAFDGDPYTSFDYKSDEGGWTGIDLVTPKLIKKIIYVPRNRDNFIRKGDTYELLYWKNRKWNSTGYKIAQTDSLTYYIPKGSLLYLKNHTRGKDERIFEYKNGKQIFW